MPSREELQAQADALQWFHSIDLGNGVRTKGLSNVQLPAAQFPDFSGRTVLDIGAWDGYYSFLAERGGASRVVALDHYAWGVDMVARGGYWNECFQNGTLPDQSLDLTEFWRPELPGRRGFEFAASAIGSKVEPYLADFTTTDLEAVGTFQVVLYLGVLYHMKEPLTCLERLRAVTTEVAVIETLALHMPKYGDESILQFHSGGEMGTDFGNWYEPNMTGLHALCRAAGFSTMRTVVGPPDPAPPPPLSTRSRVGRRVRGAMLQERPTPPLDHYRAVVHAFV
jgi:tRNA (mo5U34)-methyltransferase